MQAARDVALRVCGRTRERCPLVPQPASLPVSPCTRGLSMVCLANLPNCTPNGPTPALATLCLLQNKIPLCCSPLQPASHPSATIRQPSWHLPLPLASSMCAVLQSMSVGCGGSLRDGAASRCRWGSLAA